MLLLSIIIPPWHYLSHSPTNQLLLIVLLGVYQQKRSLTQLQESHQALQLATLTGQLGRLGDTPQTLQDALADDVECVGVSQQHGKVTAGEGKERRMGTWGSRVIQEFLAEEGGGGMCCVGNFCKAMPIFSCIIIYLYL